MQFEVLLVPAVEVDQVIKMLGKSTGLDSEEWQPGLYFQPMVFCEEPRRILRKRGG